MTKESLETEQSANASPETEPKKRKRAKANRKAFADIWIERLRPPKRGQELYWDTGQKGLALLVSAGGTKTFRSQYCLHGKWLIRSIGRFGK